MPMAERTATSTWEGDLPKGNGAVRGASGALGELPVTWASRTERSDGKTSPEELIAAAHAACFSMALSHTLTEAGHKPDKLEVSAKVTLDQRDGAPTITDSELDVTGTVPGMNEAEFQKAAQDAGKNCPVSRALGGVNVAVNAKMSAY